MTDFADIRRRMVESQLRPQGVVDPFVLEAMSTLPREDYVPASQREVAYADAIIPLGERRGLPTCSVTGRLLNAVAARPDERVMVVGAGTGYAAALFAHMGCRVTAVENDPLFADNLARLTGVTLVSGELAAGHAANAPYDVIVIDGAIEQIPPAIVEQLGEGGRIATVLVERGVGRLTLGFKAPHGVGYSSFGDVGCPALPGFARPRVFTF
ncbi:protein-L-isoaspartate O-methyltransferase [Sphingomonas ginkgonis]|uniref:Protein-L-isoaspartate O-methyltransferase n=1 Tax=Sphingomonas ginkgonis TaxID=2315330 RepID=A0A429V8P5_9SPHN|nr:protein-L-isoaspartate O-methyltransferase [Sphingomonas ginkgonis]RST30351.1 protein-L-isoaspartate O-methyltransferase [Sphingomonas ginkgonis]